MTFSLLARDPETGDLGGVAATGNLCVGGWVLRGDARGGLTASQGLSPSTLWGEDALAALVAGETASDAVSSVTSGDPGRDARQIAALSREGRTAGFDGAANKPFTGHLAGDGWIVSGNWLVSAEVIENAAETFAGTTGLLAERLLAAVAAGAASGSDRRGTLSAALLVVGADRPPLSLRVDHDPSPINRLRALYDLTCAEDYHAWLATLPTRSAPGRA